MAERRAEYLKQHIWNIIQCFLGLGCLALEWLAYRNTQTSRSSAPLAPSVGAAMTPHYSMPWYLWAGITALAFSVIIPAVIGMIRKRRPSSKLTQIPSAADDVEADRLRREEIERKADLWRAQESRRLCDEERREALKQLEEAKLQLAIFTPLQMDAFRLAKDLRMQAERGVAGCSSSDFYLMRLEYEQKFATKVKDMMFQFAREQGGEDSTLRRHVQFIDNGNDILNVINALIRLAHMQDGIDCTLRYPS